jgi:hypothetical protein
MRVGGLRGSYVQNKIQAKYGRYMVVDTGRPCCYMGAPRRGRCPTWDSRGKAVEQSNLVEKAEKRIDRACTTEVMIQELEEGVRKLFAQERRHFQEA